MYRTMKKLSTLLLLFTFCLSSTNISHSQTIAYQCQESYTTDVHNVDFNINSMYICDNLQNLITEQPNRILTRDEIEDLAEKCGLYERMQLNNHLRFQDGDISFWHEQQHNKSNLRSEDLHFEFVSRRVVLLAAENEEIFIETPGDLSHAAKKIQSKMKKEKENYIKHLKQL